MKSLPLQDYLNSRKNNMDFIRFVAAVLVIFSHSYPLTLGDTNSEPLRILTNNQIDFGHLSVSVFFIISGFLITQSYYNSKSLGKYFKSRILRIFPALITVILLTVFVLGPILTELSLKDYFTERNTYKYLLLSPTLLAMQTDLPGVFANNPFANSVNGSLWTLWYEFLFYIVVAFLGITKLLNKKFILLTFIVCILLTEFSVIIPSNLNIVTRYTGLFVYFSAGMLVYLFRKKIKLNFLYTLVSLIALIIATYFGHFSITYPILGSYVIFYLSFQRVITVHSFNKYGDFSYGIYIFAFPIQQTITYLNTNITPFQNFLYAFIISLFLAFLSWHLIERPSLTLKNKKFFNRYSYRKISRTVAKIK